MEIKIGFICGEYHEVSVDEIATGTMNKQEAMQFASNLVEAAGQILWNADEKINSEKCDALIKDIEFEI